MLTLASALLWLAALFTRDPPTLDAVPSRCVYLTGMTWLPDWGRELNESLQPPDADRAIYGATNPDLVPTEVDYLWGEPANSSSTPSWHQSGMGRQQEAHVPPFGRDIH